jgi:hypothetical protein
MNRPSRSPSPVNILDFNDYKRNFIIESNNYYKNSNSNINNNIPITFIIFVCINMTVFIAYLFNNIVHS